MSGILVHDSRFERLIIGHAKLQKLWTGGLWLEGPAYVPAGRYLVFSDIPNDRMLRFNEADGSVSVFRQPCGYTNGHTLDREGRLVSCEHQGRCVSRIEHDGSRTVLASHVGGKRLNSPNDVVVAQDGAIWFTDPTYGIDSDYEGDAAISEINTCHVYRIPHGSGEPVAMVTDRVQPNGLAFSPGADTLYVSDTGGSHVPGLPSTITAYPVTKDGSVARGYLFATCEHGVFDGFRCDMHGNIWTSAGTGVNCYAPDGALIGTIQLPEIAANVQFGGPKRNCLYICAQTSLYAMFLATRSAS